MRQAGVLAACALYALEHNVARLAEDHANARYLAKSLRLALGLAGTPIRLSLRRGTPRARTRPGTRKAAR